MTEIVLKKPIVTEVMIDEALATRVKISRKRQSNPISIRIWLDKLEAWKNEVLKSAIVKYDSSGKKILTIYPPVYKKPIKI